MTGTAVVLVPMLGRPQMVVPFMDSLRATTDCRTVFVCSPDDNETITACKEASDTIVVSWRPDRADFALKTNLGFRETSEAWIFCGAIDLDFHPNWLEHAITVGDRAQAGVVGTQDLGNPTVKRGQASTHPLVRRTYIETQGGTFDNTGDIYSEKYDHQFIDVELVWVAKQRGQWAFAKNSVVEHLHPNWGKAETDATYDKAFRAVKEDRALFEQRMLQFRTVETRQRVGARR